ncbi:unnamed protein product [Hermetia illucens]|uniref:Odorant receptor n=1 Tax=Hermetia illucens TaxID=343691 RepID=A0A7R8YU41_HERIL|nr:odorant receptor 59a-like [Hermetia illucens]CAD7085747.1 unnamed protein product [Hermetia illucens]
MVHPLDTMSYIKTNAAFKHNWACWRFLGMHPTERYKALYAIYSMVLNITITLFYPSSLVIAVFLSDNIKQILEALVLTATNVACSSKQINAFLRRSDILAIESLLPRLDSRAHHSDEQRILKAMIKTSYTFFYVYFVVYVSTGLLSEIATLFATNKRLMYPAWLPFDWKSSNFNYAVANIYQFVGIMVGIVQECVNDTFPAIYMGVLTGHIQALMKRIERIGTNTRISLERNYEELVHCIQDYQILKQYYNVLQPITSGALFLQFFVTAIVVCITAVYLVFVDGSAFDMIYLGFYFACILMEILLSCYYGNELLYESHLITNAIYSCSWTEQSERFKKVMIIFMQSTQMDMSVKAGGLINVNLESYMAVLKSSYSLFAVLIKAT